MIPSDISLTSRTHKADPYRLYAQLRAESPVHRVSLPGKMSAWIVTRYDDVMALLKDERFRAATSHQGLLVEVALTNSTYDRRP